MTGTFQNKEKYWARQSMRLAVVCIHYTGLLIIQSNPIMFWGLGSFDPKDSILNIFSWSLLITWLRETIKDPSKLPSEPFVRESEVIMILGDVLFTQKHFMATFADM